MGYLTPHTWRKCTHASGVSRQADKSLGQCCHYTVSLKWLPGHNHLGWVLIFITLKFAPTSSLQVAVLSSLTVSNTKNCQSFCTKLHHDMWTLKIIEMSHTTRIMGHCLNVATTIILDLDVSIRPCSGPKNQWQRPMLFGVCLPLYIEAIQTNVVQVSRVNSDINKNICMNMNNMAWLVQYPPA